MTPCNPMKSKEENLEAPTGIEPVMRALQAPALPLGYGAERMIILQPTGGVKPGWRCWTGVGVAAFCLSSWRFRLGFTPWSPMGVSRVLSLDKSGLFC